VIPVGDQDARDTLPRYFLQIFLARLHRIDA
jgi:hypothetical protein